MIFCPADVPGGSEQTLSVISWLRSVIMQVTCRVLPQASKAVQSHCYFNKFHLEGQKSQSSTLDLLSERFIIFEIVNCIFLTIYTLSWRSHFVVLETNSWLLPPCCISVKYLGYLEAEEAALGIPSVLWIRGMSHIRSLKLLALVLDKTI